MSKNRTKAVLALLVATLIWATTYATAKVGLQAIAPFTLALIRGIIATVILLGFSIASGLTKEIIVFLKKHFLAAILLGTLGTFLLHALNNFGLMYSSSIMGGVLINTSPIFTLFLSVIVLKERATRSKLLGILFGFIGIVVLTLVGEDFSRLTAQSAFVGNIMLIGVAVCWAIYSVMVKKFLNTFQPLTLTFVSYFIGTLFFLPTTLLTENITLVRTYTVTSWVIILYLGIFASAGAYLLWNYGVKHYEVSKASVYAYLAPAIAIVLGFLFLREAISIFDIIGMALIFGGIYISERTI